MRRAGCAALAVLVLSALNGSLSAKGITAKITIEGADLAMPIEISDAATVRRISVWSGPGISMNGVEATEGFIVDWQTGVVSERPPGLQRYRVSFSVRPWNLVSQRYDGNPQLAYVVFYERDASSDRGYVYLPGRRDREYDLNVRTIFRGSGLEGGWFRASAAWQQLVTPLLARAAR
jgi:hypothetical protein